MNSMNQLALRSALSHGTSTSSHHHHHRHQALQPFSPYANQYGHVFPGISSYSSSVVTMTSDGMGQRQVYEASSSTRLAPGGVRETKSAVRDSRTGRHEMSIGHHMHDKSHVIKKSKNVFTGQEDHEEDYVNVEEDEEANFETEWQRRARAGYHRSSSYRQAYPSSSSRPGLTITELPAEPTRLALPAPPVEATNSATTSATATAQPVPRYDRHRMPYYATAASIPPADHRTTERLADPLSRVNGHQSTSSATLANGVHMSSAGPSSSSTARRSESPLDQMRRDRREKSKHKRDRPY